MSIKPGDRIPDVTIKTMGPEGPTDITTADIFGGKKVVLFALPGAFTPGCSMAHLPGYVVNADKIKAKGVDTIACLSVNDAFVMDAWGKAQNAEEILMLADGNGAFTEAVDLTLDASGFGMGNRSQRYAMVVNDGVVASLHVETGPGVEASAAETILAEL